MTVAFGPVLCGLYSFLMQHKYDTPLQSHFDKKKKKHCQLPSETKKYLFTPSMEDMDGPKTGSHLTTIVYSPETPA